VPVDSHWSRPISSPSHPHFHPLVSNSLILFSSSSSSFFHLYLVLNSVFRRQRSLLINRSVRYLPLHACSTHSSLPDLPADRTASHPRRWQSSVSVLPHPSSCPDGLPNFVSVNPVYISTSHSKSPFSVHDLNQWSATWGSLHRGQAKTS
jgi:hypothetical protein